MNRKQLEAVHETGNNSIILACPGSGKTHTLISKIVYLINRQNVDPKRIILITYTKKTSLELSARLNKMVPGIQLLYIGTMHGLAFRTIQTYADIKLKIMDESDTLAILNDKLYLDVLEQLTSSYPISLEQVLSGMKLDRCYDEVNKVLTAYTAAKKEGNFVDFGDIMLLFIQFLRASTEQTTEFKQSYDYIFFDEYQDINSIQDLILKEMNTVCNNLTVVGDDAQAIYKFRGSSVKFIQEFHQTYKDAKQFVLDVNYRSTPEIIDFCNDLISHNNDQIKRTMLPERRSNGLKPYVHGFSTANEEANFIYRRILQNKNYSEQVILSRNNRQLDIYELLLLRHKIPYLKSKGASILERDHVVDFIAFLYVLVNRGGSQQWRRILALFKVDEQFATRNLNEVIDDPVKYGLNNLVPMSHTIKTAQQITRNREYDELFTLFMRIVEPIIEKATFSKVQEDIRLLITYLAEIGSINPFIDELFQTHDTDNKLFLSTIHGSKGLEWETVYLIGCSSDLMPYIRHNEWTKQILDVEEERRLFYVGCTRARSMLFITMSYDFHRFTNNLSPLIYTSSFISNMCKTKYYGINLRFPTKKQGDTKLVINHYLALNGTTDIHNSLKQLHYTYKSWYPPFINTLPNRTYEEFINTLTIKMVNNNWQTLIPGLAKTLPVYVTNDEHCVFYQQVETMVRTLIPANAHITIGLRLENEDGVISRSDIIVDRTLIKISSSNECTANVNTLLQAIMCRYLLRRMNIGIDTIILVNPLLGETHTISIKTDEWKDTYKVYKKIMK